VVTRGAPDSDEEIFCTITERRLARAVVECNRYVDRNQPSLWDMRQIAWVLDTDSRRQRIGFIRAREWEAKHADEDLLPAKVDRAGLPRGSGSFELHC
jgi:hypothetical protein